MSKLFKSDTRYLLVE